MSPLSAKEREEILARPGVTAELIDEFEGLVSEFFMFDPDMITAEEELQRHCRIVALHEIMFPGQTLSLSPVGIQETRVADRVKLTEAVQ
jgi:hypothetical protein